MCAAMYSEIKTADLCRASIYSDAGDFFQLNLFENYLKTHIKITVLYIAINIALNIAINISIIYKKSLTGIALAVGFK